MGTKQQIWFTYLGIPSIMVVGILVFAWPWYRERHEISLRLHSLQSKVSSLTDRTAELERLAREVEDARKVIATLRTIPDSPDIASLMRELSIPVDGWSVLDQTFASSTATDAVPDADLSTQAMPVTVEMEASFDSLFSLVNSAESMNRLVRVASVRITSEETEDRSVAPMLHATVGLEAIFEPGAE